MEKLGYKLNLFKADAGITVPCICFFMVRLRFSAYKKRIKIFKEENEMMKRNMIKFGIDFAMVVVFDLLFNKMVLGMAFHEIAGLAIGYSGWLLVAMQF